MGSCQLCQFCRHRIRRQAMNGVHVDMISILAGGQQAFPSYLPHRDDEKAAFSCRHPSKARGGIDFIAGRHLIQMADVGLDRNSCCLRR